MAALLFLGTSLAAALGGTTAVRAAEVSLEVRAAWARPTIGARGTTAAYFVIKNLGSEPDALTGVETPAASRAELHETIVDGDIAQMRHLERVELPPGEETWFAPGGKHVMVMGLASALNPGDKLLLILHFASGARLQVEAVASMEAP